MVPDKLRPDVFNKFGSTFSESSLGWKINELIDYLKQKEAKDG